MKEFNLLGLMGAVFLLFTLAATIAPNFIRARAQGRLSACKSNLKNLGTAMEMYSSDCEGKYPLYMMKLTPNYLKTIPECPNTGRVTYRMTFGAAAPYNTQNYQDYYFVECTGEGHVPLGAPPNYPQYNGIVGLMER